MQKYAKKYVRPNFATDPMLSWNFTTLKPQTVHILKYVQWQTFFLKSYLIFTMRIVHLIQILLTAKITILCPHNDVRSQ